MNNVMSMVMTIAEANVRMVPYGPKPKPIGIGMGPRKTINPPLTRFGKWSSELRSIRSMPTNVMKKPMRKSL